jgi:hypothetical protein
MFCVPHAFYHVQAVVGAQCAALPVALALLGEPSASSLAASSLALLVEDK